MRSRPTSPLPTTQAPPFPIVCSLEWIESLDPEDRALIEEGVALACEQQREEERANEMEYIERFKEEGATVRSSPMKRSLLSRRPCSLCMTICVRRSATI